MCFGRVVAPSVVIFTSTMGFRFTPNRPVAPTKVLLPGERWGFVVIGDDALNEDKLKVDGLMESAHIPLGCEVGLNEFTIALPRWE